MLRHIVKQAQTMSPSESIAKKDTSQRRRDDASVASNSADLTDVGEVAFLGIFEDILVDDPVSFDFDGSISREHMRAIWSWLVRDVDPEIQQTLTGVSSVVEAEKSLKALFPTVLTKARDAVSAASIEPESDRRLTAQLGGEDVRSRIPVVLNALRCHALLPKAVAFGKASNSLTDEVALGTALQSMPLKEVGIAALLLHSVVGQAANPSRVVSAIGQIAGGSSEVVIKGAGFGPVIDGILAHAQNQLSKLAGQNSLFADADLMCKAVDRFHKLIRAVTGYVELERGSRWSMISAEITKNMAQGIGPRLREVSADVSKSLRKPREGADRVDADRLLAALNGIYLLESVRNARESLALNALFEQIWGETGQTLEVLLQRNMELFKQDPTDSNTAQRLDMGIKMAEVRFNAEYAEILRKARDSVSRRIDKDD